jgi:NitT/TauT family transport system ATP-binding protein
MSFPEEEFVRLDNISKRFNDEINILENVNLVVRKNEFITFVGPSGCGKSTLLRLIAGLLNPSSGTLSVEGKTPQAKRHETAFVFQDASLLPWRRALANVELPLELRGEEKQKKRSRAQAMLTLVGLEGAEKKYPWQLSGGMKMRVSIARALSTSPKILLLDEPFGALDEMSRHKLNEDLLAIKQQDPFTAFFVTHSVSEAIFLSTRVVILSQKPGRIHTIIDVPFDYPRTAELRESDAFLKLQAQAMHKLREVL